MTGEGRFPEWVDAGSPPFTMRLLVTGFRPIELHTTLHFDPAEPGIIGVQFVDPAGTVKLWQVPRERIAFGLMAPEQMPAESDDVMIWGDPDLPIITMRLTGVEGQVLVRGAAAPFAMFLAQTAARVPTRAARRQQRLGWVRRQNDGFS